MLSIQSQGKVLKSGHGHLLGQLKKTLVDALKDHLKEDNQIANIKLKTALFQKLTDVAHQNPQFASQVLPVNAEDGPLLRRLEFGKMMRIAEE